LLVSLGQNLELERLRNVQAERNDLAAQLADLRQHFDESEADRAARLAVIEEQASHLGKVEAERNDLAAQLADLRQQFDESEADRAAGLVAIEEPASHLSNVVASSSDCAPPSNADLPPSQHFQMAGVNIDLLSEIDHLWESRSWKMSRPVRNVYRRLKGAGKEVKPVPQSDAEAAHMIVALRQSLSWELTSPIRLVYRIFSRT